MKIPNFTALTLFKDCRLNVLKTRVSISADKNINPDFIKSKEDFIAIWDTGATGTVISRQLADELKLTPIGKTKVGTAGGICDSNMYMISLKLPNRVVIENVMVTSGELGKDTDFLIGMDIITLGDFSITNVDSKTTFSFRVPSCEKIDYVEQARVLREKDLKTQLKSIENDIKRKGKCPCGSGKLYRYCCGKKQIQEIQNELEKITS